MEEEREQLRKRIDRVKKRVSQETFYCIIPRTKYPLESNSVHVTKLPTELINN